MGRSSQRSSSDSGRSSGGFSGESRSSGSFSGGSGGGRSSDAYSSGGSSSSGYSSSGSSSDDDSYEDEFRGFFSGWDSKDFGSPKSDGWRMKSHIHINSQDRHQHSSRGNGKSYFSFSSHYNHSEIHIHDSNINIDISSGSDDHYRPKEQRYPKGCSYTPAGVGIFFIFLFVLILVFFLMSRLSSCSNDVPPSTVSREKLPSSAVKETAYYTDGDGSWIRSPSRLEAGMRTFYQETGVQPYLYIFPNGSTRSSTFFDSEYSRGLNLTEEAEKLYDKLFSDEGHFLLVFCDNDYGSFDCGYTVGFQAKTVMDEEAVGILAYYLDRYYRNYSISEEEIFSHAFADTAKRIMAVTQSPVVPIVISIGVIVVAVLVFLCIREYNKKKKRDQEYTERILNTPLHKFGDLEAEDLADKYKD